MKKFLLFLTPFIIVSIIFYIFVFSKINSQAKGALQVTSKPKSNVYLNGKVVGQTPLCKCEGENMLEEGEYNIKVVPLEGSFSPFEEKIKISKSVLTVVDRTFGQEGSSEGSIINLDPIDDVNVSQLLVLSFPDGVKVTVDSNPSGNTPILLKNLTPSDHELKIAKDGYKGISIRIRSVLGYKLTVLGYLGIDQGSTTLNQPKAEEIPATLSASLKDTVIIQKTQVGFLRVRESNNISSQEVGKVYPDETYEILEENNGWFKITLSDGKVGWINGQYAKKQNL
ncbi:MAG: PEGA domain-containing protein [bacterium]|nr:PEGA domain-containing protein [bacterium]